MNSRASWKVYMPEEGERELTICYSCDSLSAGQPYWVEVEGAGMIEAKTLAGPKGFEEFYTRHLGKVNFHMPEFIPSMSVLRLLLGKNCLD